MVCSCHNEVRRKKKCQRLDCAKSVTCYVHMVQKTAVDIIILDVRCFANS